MSETDPGPPSGPVADGQAPAPASPPEDLQVLEGVVTRIVYRSEDSGYTVCGVRPAGGRGGGRTLSLFDRAPAPGAEEAAGRDEVTVVGTCAALWVGENLKATGRWVHHRRHGRQFQAETIACIAPVTVEGIRMYLAGGMIKGIGEKTANRLVDFFGDDTLRVIDKESSRLCDVPGIGRKTREKIRESWIAQKAMRDTMIFLRGHGVGGAQAHRIYRQYGADSVAVVSRNPYRLCQEVWGIGFRSADKIATNLGLPAESDVRARAGILYALQTMADEGHCFCPWEVLVEQAQELLNIPSAILDAAVAFEVQQGQLVHEEGNVYLAPLHHAEAAIARRLRLLAATPSAFRPIDTDKAIPWAEKRMGIAFAPAQAEAIHMALSRRMSIITGGPGVGKTTIIRALVDVFSARGLRVALAAPTGRAAKRLAEATRSEAMTLHRLLKFQPRLRTFEYGADNPLPGDVFILDEVSMVDVSLMQSFVRALAPSSHLILVGDSDQLPSVGPGNVLKDMIASGAVPCRRLDTVFRQQSRSWIVHNAHRVNGGQMPEVPAGQALSDFYFVRLDEPDAMIANLLSLVTERIPQRFGLNPRTDIQVLTPMRKNQLGADNLNTVLQQAVNPSGPGLQRFGITYRAGDRVMQLRNNYDKDVFNGDIGVIASVDPGAEGLAVDFDGRRVPYESDELDELDLAYASSIHKSQGSEYPAVVIVLATQHFKLLQRNLLYTAITRGRKLVCLVGSPKAVHIAVRNNQTLLRRTSLARRLQETASSAG